MTSRICFMSNTSTRNRTCRRPCSEEREMPATRYDDPSARRPGSCVPPHADDPVPVGHGPLLGKTPVVQPRHAVPHELLDRLQVLEPAPGRVDVDGVLGEVGSQRRPGGARPLRSGHGRPPSGGTSPALPRCSVGHGMRPAPPWSALTNRRHEWELPPRPRPRSSGVSSCGRPLAH